MGVSPIRPIMPINSKPQTVVQSTNNIRYRVEAVRKEISSFLYSKGFTDSGVKVYVGEMSRLAQAGEVHIQLCNNTVSGCEIKNLVTNNFFQYFDKSQFATTSTGISILFDF